MALVTKPASQSVRVAYTLHELIVLVMASKRGIGQKEAGALVNKMVPAMQKKEVAASVRTPNSIGFAYRNKIYADGINKLSDLNPAWTDEVVAKAQKDVVEIIKTVGGDTVKLLPQKDDGKNAPESDNKASANAPKGNGK